MEYCLKQRTLLKLNTLAAGRFDLSRVQPQKDIGYVEDCSRMRVTTDWLLRMSRNGGERGVLRRQPSLASQT